MLKRYPSPRTDSEVIVNSDKLTVYINDGEKTVEIPKEIWFQILVDYQ